MNTEEHVRHSRFGECACYCGMLVLAFASSLFLWMLIAFVEYDVRHDPRGIPQAAVTVFAFDYALWVRYFPIPWLLFALVILWRGHRTTRDLVVFSSTLTLALFTLAMFIAVALVNRWL
jgi:hypothetical protein